MLESFYIAVFTFFFFTGVISVLFAVLMRVIRPRDGELNYAVAVFDAEEKNAVARISYLLTRVSAAGDRNNTIIIAVDNGMTADQYKAVLRAFSSESRVMICSPSTIGNVILGQK